MEKKRILICDSNPSVRQFIKFSLEGHLLGIEISMAPNGKNVQGKLQKNHYDLVIYEREMPELNGDEMLKWLRTHQALNGTPFIMISTDRHEESLRQAIELKVNGYIIKPFTADQIVEKVKTVLSD